ncbi:DUF4857 domain-containing protein [Lamprobacter modestohalophilus]|uniref:DUF4857 domain-containing protein n=1 Tax=Lamprobacter modestohalophilus TaxID=1064514 RepID=UPI002ADEB188|nr:DUF4857 domain-containing protein [Lamprobacter modestohalophilus]MEA1051851.1 DUF4857 domain-containing protein [Lamprobacter modestohalophilus]
MTARIARWSLLLLTIVLLAVWWPLLKDLLFEYRYGKTDLFYSPVIERFVYKELLGEGHEFLYRDQDGNDYDRQTFETLIPFIYYKNMELWGKLPLQLAGQSFDKAQIQAARQVLELKPGELPGHAPRIQLFPLLEANPGRARLRFPEDILGPGERLTFINSDRNRIDPELTARFTEALSEAGFVWPVQATFGRVSILKAFDAGFFLLDRAGQLFQLRRVDGLPEITPVPLPEGLQVHHLKVAENKRGEYLGLLLAEDDRLFLLGQDADRRTAAGLTPLALPGYDPETMALKILFNPLYRTAIYSNQRQIKAVAMNRAFEPIARYERLMAMAEPRLVDRVWQTLVPFSLDLRDPNGRYLRLSLDVHALAALPASAVALLLAWLLLWRRGLRFLAMTPSLLLVAFTGVYGLIAVGLIPPPEPSDRAVASVGDLGRAAMEPDAT